MLRDTITQEIPIRFSSNEFFNRIIKHFSVVFAHKSWRPNEYPFFITNATKLSLHHHCCRNFDQFPCYICNWLFASVALSSSLVLGGNFNGESMFHNTVTSGNSGLCRPQPSCMSTLRSSCRCLLFNVFDISCSGGSWSLLGNYTPWVVQE